MKIFLFFFIFFFSTNTYAINIATVDIDSILNNSESYQVFINKINIFIKKESLKFKDNEIILKKNKVDIESRKILLNVNEFNILLSNYDDQLNVYKNNINSFNLLIDENIETNKKIIVDKIIEILTEISIRDNYDLVLTNKHYLLAQNKFDITDQVINLLNEYEILLNTYNIK